VSKQALCTYDGRNYHTSPNSPQLEELGKFLAGKENEVHSSVRTHRHPLPSFGATVPDQEFRY